jgi:hypothetical protein
VICIAVPVIGNALKERAKRNREKREFTDLKALPVIDDENI